MTDAEQTDHAGTQRGGTGDRAVRVADAVRRGELTARAAAEQALARIARHDSVLGAFQLLRADAALAEADAVDARSDRSGLALAGVPIAVKDNVDLAGEPTRSGSRATSAEPATADHEVVRRLRAAGAVVVGKTRVPELCIYAATDSAYGVTRNPWDIARTPGGSSGGSAAAVASGMVSAAHGNDGLGSVRIPAACCGLFGIKPGRGTVPSNIGGNDWYGLAENGALATSVSDGAALLAVMADQPGIAEVREPDRPLTIAVSLTPPVQGVRLDREHARAVVRTARLLESVGHQVVRRGLPIPNSLAAAVFARWFGGASVDAEGMDRSLLDPAVRAHVRLGDVVRGRNLVREQPARRFAELVADFFSGVDVYLTPVLATPPIAARRWGERPLPWVLAANTRYAPYAAPSNLAGTPAASVPAGVHPQAGTPLSVQLAGPRGAESRLLGLSAQIERLAPWPRLAPAYR